MGFAGILVTTILVMDAIADASFIKTLLAAILMAIVVGDTASTIRRTYQLFISDIHYTPFHAGESFTLLVTLNNKGQQDTLVRLGLSGKKQPYTWAWVPAKGQTIIPIKVAKGPTRGRYHWPSISARAYGLGTAYGNLMWTRSNDDRPIHAWPARWTNSIPEIVVDNTPDRQPADLYGESVGTKEVSGGTGTGTEGWLRDWRSGDRLGHIAYKASAKRDRWLVRTEPPVPQGGGTIKLTWEWAIQIAADPEAAFSLLGTASERAITKGQTVGLRLADLDLPAGRGRTHLHHLLDQLSGATL